MHLVAATGLGGAERVVLNYCALADRRRYEPMVCCLVNGKRPDNAFTASCAAQGVRLERVLLTSLVGLPRVVFQTAARVRREDCALVHSHGYLSDVVGLAATSLTGRPALSTVHGWLGLGGRLGFYEALDRLVLRAFKRVHCVSLPLRDGLAASGIAPDKLAVLPNGRTTFPETGRAATALRAELGLPPRAPVVLAVGRLSPEKGHRFLIEAVAGLAAVTDAVLLLVGEGPQRESLEGQARQHGLTGRTFFAGHRDDMGDLYRLADVFVLPSLTEGTPMVLLEAMGLGLPVVATAVGGIPDCLEHDRQGLLVPAASPEALAEALLSLLRDRPRAVALGGAAKARVQAGYDPTAWARGMERLYDQVLANPERVSPGTDGGPP
jgi:glycosyltransferase involved in cell wall biosynthesis